MFDIFDMFDMFDMFDIFDMLVVFGMFDTFGTEGSKWDFKPTVTTTWGWAQPLGLRIELKGGVSAKGKWASKK